MAYCSQCGVEVEDETRHCPLCQAPIQHLQKLDHPERHYPDKASPSASVAPMNLREKLRLARGISIIVFLIPMFFSWAIDLFINRSTTWSSFVIIALAGILMITLVTLFFPKRGWLINLLSHVILILLCFFLNLVTGLTNPWSITIALPIFGSSWLLTQGILSVAKFKKGNLLAAAILLGTGLLCLAVDAILFWALRAAVSYGWSLIVISAVVPTALLLLYLYSTKFRKSKFHRFFHL
ncbi:MAG: hypothetical protein PF447_04805 [Spirochaetaceae bacterium]|jgi:hypothetical protein|nr:hypothetical protein [Spirochaetaceae bacterium]